MQSNCDPDLSEFVPPGMLPEVPADPDLLAQGWVRRFVADSGRVDEATELYRSMGHEVRMEPLSKTDFGPACCGCVAQACKSYVLIYTRKK